MDVLHVVPLGDLVEHTADDDCCCGPMTRPAQCDDGSTVWLKIHGRPVWSAVSSDQLQVERP